MSPVLAATLVRPPAPLHFGGLTTKFSLLQFPSGPPDLLQRLQRLARLVPPLVAGADMGSEGTAYCATGGSLTIRQRRKRWRRWQRRP